MREIKFRAYKNNKQYFVYSIEKDSDGNFTEVNIYDEYKGQIKIGCTHDSCNNEYYDKVYLAQYTGLKDKNGKEIYVDDVLGVYAFFGEYEEGYKSIGIGKGYFDVKFGAFCVERTNGGRRYLGEYLMKNKATEIIGNIYENPELLNRKENNDKS